MFVIGRLHHPHHPFEHLDLALLPPALEALPSPIFERDAFEHEREHAQVELLDQSMHAMSYYFYAERLTLTPTDLDALGALLGDDELTLDEKKACEFHPDFAFVWNGGEDMAMVCLTCRELAIQSGTRKSGSLRYEKFLELQALLSPYRRNRPLRDAEP